MSRPCVATALTLYSEILGRIEDSDFAVFAHRARVGQLRRVGVAVRRTGPRVLGPQNWGRQLTWTTTST